MIHRRNQSFQWGVRRNAGFFFRLAEQLGNPGPTQYSRNRRATENNQVRLFLCQDLNAVPVVANGLLDSLRSIVLEAEPGGYFHDVQWHKAVELVSGSTLEFFV